MADKDKVPERKQIEKIERKHIIREEGPRNSQTVSFDKPIPPEKPRKD